MCSECFEVLNCQCKYCNFESVLKDEELMANHEGCPECGHTPLGFYNLESWKKKNEPSDDYVEIVLEVS
jgi:hypothetical protein